MLSEQQFSETWHQSWSESGAAAANQLLCRDLLARWGEAHRHYHSLQHLGECLTHFNRLRHLAHRPAEVALALWFHDAIYELKATDNERRSADWAAKALLAAAVPADSAARVHALVMATRHDAVPTNPDQQLLVDIDLSILGAAPARYEEYEQQVRAEYAFVPENAFRQGRLSILQSFMARPSIYNTAAFLASHESQARHNLTQAIAQLV